jgi:phosphonate transport system substrate-binding protein
MKRILFTMVLLSWIIGGAFSNGDGEEGSQEMGSWQEKYPTLVISAVSSENEADRLARYKYMQDYLSEQLGVQVDFYSASDYAGTIEAMAAGKVHIGRFGTASYARAWRVTDGGVKAVLCDLNPDGSSGYHSVIWVREDSPYQSIDDLAGKSLAFADPNSTSGYLVPTYYLTTAEDKAPNEYFGETGFAGNHEGAILALLDGTYDAAANWYTNENRSNAQRMAAKGMIDDSKLRLIWKSPLITNGPFAVLDELPQEMVDDFVAALKNWAVNDPEGYAAHYAPNSPAEFLEVNHERYADFIAMQEWVDKNAE